MAYPVEFKIKVVEAHERGKSIRAIADFFGISTRTVCKYLKEKKETGSVGPAKPQPGAVPKITEKAMEHLFKMIDENPAVTLEKMRTELRNQFSIAVTPPAIHNRLVLAGYSFKKKLHEPLKETHHESTGKSSNS